MEEIKSTVRIVKERPPAEPHPSQELKQCRETTQWLHDVQTTAQQQLNTQSLSNIATLNGETYTPFHNSVSNNQEIQQYLLTSKIQTLYRTKYPRVQKLGVPTPKTVKRPSSFSTHPKDADTMK